MTHTGPITFAAGFALGLFVCGLILQNACAGDTNKWHGLSGPHVRSIMTEDGINCVILDRTAISCNWDEYNFKKYQDNILIPAPSKGSMDIPI